MKKQFRKSFVFIVTMEYQNVRASVNCSTLIICPGMLPDLCNRPILFLSSCETPCSIYVIKIISLFKTHFSKIRSYTSFYQVFLRTSKLRVSIQKCTSSLSLHYSVISSKLVVYRPNTYELYAIDRNF
jgi:hypothetical protein